MGRRLTARGCLAGELSDAPALRVERVSFLRARRGPVDEQRRAVIPRVVKLLPADVRIGVQQALKTIGARIRRGAELTYKRRLRVERSLLLDWHAANYLWARNGSAGYTATDGTAVLSRNARPLSDTFSEA